MEKWTINMKNLPAKKGHNVYNSDGIEILDELNPHRKLTGQAAINPLSESKVFVFLNTPGSRLLLLLPLKMFFGHFFGFIPFRCVCVVAFIGIFKSVVPEKLILAVISPLIKNVILLYPWHI